MAAGPIRPRSPHRRAARRRASAPPATSPAGTAVVIVVVLEVSEGPSHPPYGGLKPNPRVWCELGLSCPREVTTPQPVRCHATIMDGRQQCRQHVAAGAIYCHTHQFILDPLGSALDSRNRTPACRGSPGRSFLRLTGLGADACCGGFTAGCERGTVSASAWMGARADADQLISGPHGSTTSDLTLAAPRPHHRSHICSGRRASGLVRYRSGPGADQDH